MVKPTIFEFHGEGDCYDFACWLKHHYSDLPVFLEDTILRYGWNRYRCSIRSAGNLETAINKASHNNWYAGCVDNKGIWNPKICRGYCCSCDDEYPHEEMHYIGKTNYKCSDCYTKKEGE